METIKNLLDSNTDTTIIYQGGSGGFFLYYLLLLSGKYISGDADIQQSTDIVSTVKQKIVEQFPDSLKDDRSQWKATEFWPNNNSIKDQSFSKKKLFLICNPLFNEGNILDNLKIVNGTKIALLYTDIDTQLRMAYDKKAYWFTEISKKKFNAPVTKYRYMRQIKSSYIVVKNTRVDPRVGKLITVFNPNFIINLSDLICSKDLNSDQRTFLTHWLSLQSRKAIRCLKI
jgi:hypothetical protein